MTKTLEQRVQALEDREAIVQLKARKRGICAHSGRLEIQNPAL
jgi:hypothetical protein